MNVSDIKQFFPQNVSERVFIIALIILAATSFVFWVQKSWGDQVATSDSAFYEETALNFLAGEGFSRDGVDAGMLPGYQIFLVGIFSVAGHNLDAVRITQGVLFVLTVLLTYQIGKIVLNRAAARYAALFLAVFYPLPILGGFLRREALIAFALVALAYALSQIYHTQKHRWILISGLLLGMFVWVTDISKFLVIPLFLALLAMSWSAGLKMIVFRSVLFIGAFGVFFGAALAYSVIQYDSAGLTQRGMVLYHRAEIAELISKNYAGYFIGHAAGYYFAERVSPGIDVRAFRSDNLFNSRRDALSEQGFSSFERDQILFEEGLQKIKENFSAFLFMSVLDFISLNSTIVPNGEKWQLNYMLLTFAEGRHDNIPDILKAGYLLLLRGIWYAALVFAVFFAIRELRADWRKVIFLVLILLYFNAVYSATHAIPRYAVPLYPLYILFMAGGLSVSFHYLRGRLGSFFTRKVNEK